MGYVLGLAGDMCAAARDDDVTQFKTCEEMRMKWGKYRVSHFKVSQSKSILK